jgi:hypothetical protein
MSMQENNDAFICRGMSSHLSIAQWFSALGDIPVEILQFCLDLKLVDSFRAWLQSIPVEKKRKENGPEMKFGDL